MVKIAKIDQNSFSGSSYGNIQRIGTTKDNRAIYQVIDSNNQMAGHLTVPVSQIDMFEKAYSDIMETAPKIQDFALKNSSEQDIKKRRTTSRLLTAAGGIIGVAIPASLSNGLSTTKKVLSIVTGVIAGLSLGFISSLAITTPPGTIKFAKASRNISKVDIKPLNE